MGRRDRWSATTFGLGSITLGRPAAHHRLRLGVVHPRSAAPGVSDPRPRPPPRHGLGRCPRRARPSASPCCASSASSVSSFLAGRPRGASRRAAIDGGMVGRVGLVVLGLSCLALAAAAPWVVRFIADGLAPVVPHAIHHRRAQGTVGAPTGVLRLLDPLAVVAVRRPAYRARDGRAGHAGLVEGEPAAGPARAAWRSALARGRRTRQLHPLRVRQRAAPRARQRPRLPALVHGSPGTRRRTPVRRRATPTTPTSRCARTWSNRSRPTSTGRLGRSGCGGPSAKRLQSGRLDAYVAYMLVALLVLLADRRRDEIGIGAVAWQGSPQGRR